VSQGRRWRTTLVVLLLSLAFLVGASPRAHLYDAALADIGDKSPVPIYLPSRFPNAIDANEIHDSVGKADLHGYRVELYYEIGIGDAGFAGLIAGFIAANDGPSALPAEVNARLPNGTPAAFRPISCGGSCAPANLWWRVGKFVYQVQLKLRSNSTRDAQLEALLGMADSMQEVQGVPSNNRWRGP
jgi:hypothetical protein